MLVDDVSIDSDADREHKPAGWSAQFSEPIRVSETLQLRTLRDAGLYVSRLPEDIYRTKPWRTATHLLIEAAEGTCTVELARFAIVFALIPA